MEGVILMDKIKLEKLRNKITKEFNIKFFNGEINFINMYEWKYTVDAVNSKAFENISEDIIDTLLSKENSLEVLYEMAVEFHN